MLTYTFWNNKGGTGKTSLAFEAITRYAEKHRDKNVLVVDLCPQANLSELLLGGLVGDGGRNLASLYTSNKRISIGGYFQDRLSSPFTVPNLNYKDYLCKPSNYNKFIAKNIDLLAGDSMVEVQSNAIATLSNMQIPGVNTWLAVIDWLNDFIELTKGSYDYIFIDTNPSFSIYTQIALAATDKLIIPVMADDSSRRAMRNVFSLVYGIGMVSMIYDRYSFAYNFIESKRELPMIHLVVKNRIAEHMIKSPVYSSIFAAIDEILVNVLNMHKNIFSFDDLNCGTVSIRDFQEVGSIAFAKGSPFSKVTVGKHDILGKDIEVKQERLNECADSINSLVDKL